MIGGDQGGPGVEVPQRAEIPVCIYASDVRLICKDNSLENIRLFWMPKIDVRLLIELAANACACQKGRK